MLRKFYTVVARIVYKLSKRRIWYKNMQYCACGKCFCTFWEYCPFWEGESYELGG